MTVVIHHDQDCGTSQNVLALIEASGETPVVVPCPDTGWTRPQLLALFAAAALAPRTDLRTTNSPASDLGLFDPYVDEDALIAAMLEHPTLVNPIVCSSKGVRLCRPSEAVLDVLDRLPPGPMAKDNGSLLIDAEGNRVG